MIFLNRKNIFLKFFYLLKKLGSKKINSKYLALLQYLFNERITLDEIKKLDPNKKKRSITPYLNGKKHGLQKIYLIFKFSKDHEDGEFLSNHVRYYQDIKHGEELIFDKDNILVLKRNYNFGKFHGFADYFYPSGKIMIRDKYLKGKLIDETFFPEV